MSNKRWMRPAERAVEPPFFAVFRNCFQLSEPGVLRFTWSADERAQLFCDGERIADGPPRGTPQRWFTSTVELPLPPGRQAVRFRQEPDRLCADVGRARILPRRGIRPPLSRLGVPDLHGLFVLRQQNRLGQLRPSADRRGFQLVGPLRRRRRVATAITNSPVPAKSGCAGRSRAVNRKRSTTPSSIRANPATPGPCFPVPATVSA